MNNILFTSVNTLKEYNVIDDNIPENAVTASVNKMQETVICDILGTNLYDRIRTEIDNGKVSNEIQVLIKEYVEPCLAYLVKGDLQVELSFKTKASGVKQTNDSNYNNAYLSEIKWMKEQNDMVSGRYAERLKAFLVTYKDVYPEYLTQRDNSDMRPKSYFRTNSNIFI